MTGRRVTFYWRFCWAFLSPVFMTIVFFYSLTTLETLQYGQEDYQIQYIIAGWSMFAIGVILTPLWFVWVLSHKTKAVGLRKSFEPSKYWGPKDETTRTAWIKFREEARQRKEQIIREQNHSWVQQKLYTLCGKY